MKVVSNERAPHRAVIFISAEVHEVLASGEFSGRAVEKIEQFPVQLDGADRAICIRKLNELLSEVKQKCRG